MHGLYTCSYDTHVSTLKIYVCMYVSMYVYLFVCMFVCMYVLYICLCFSLQYTLSYDKVICKRVLLDCSKKLRKFTTVFSDLRKSISSFVREIQIFIQARHLCDLCIFPVQICVFHCYACIVHVCTSSSILKHESFSTEITKSKKSRIVG